MDVVTLSLHMTAHSLHDYTFLTYHYAIPNELGAGWSLYCFGFLCPHVVCRCRVGTKVCCTPPIW